MDPNTTQTPTPRKRGPKPKIGEGQKAKVCSWLEVGASRADCAGLLEVSTDTLARALKLDTQFADRARAAQKQGKLQLVKKVKSAKAWQAAAWLLERKYGAEYGRRDRLEHTGRNGGPIKSETKVGPLDLGKLSDEELETLREIRAKASREPSVN